MEMSFDGDVIWWRRHLMKTTFAEDDICWRRHLLKTTFDEADLWWSQPLIKTTFDEDDLWWRGPLMKMTFDKDELWWRRPLMKDDLWFLENYILTYTKFRQQAQILVARHLHWWKLWQSCARCQFLPQLMTLKWIQLILEYFESYYISGQTHGDCFSTNFPQCSFQGDSL